MRTIERRLLGHPHQGDTQLSEADLRAIHLPPFQAAVQRGVGAVMISFSSWNGVKMHSNAFLITSVLKDELRFSGFVITSGHHVRAPTASTAGNDLGVVIPGQVPPATNLGAVIRER